MWTDSIVVRCACSVAVTSDSSSRRVCVRPSDRWKLGYRLPSRPRGRDAPGTPALITGSADCCRWASVHFLRGSRGEACRGLVLRFACPKRKSNRGTTDPGSRRRSRWRAIFRRGGGGLVYEKLGFVDARALCHCQVAARLKALSVIAPSCDRTVLPPRQRPSTPWASGLARWSGRHDGGSAGPSRPPAWPVGSGERRPCTPRVPEHPDRR